MNDEVCPNCGNDRLDQESVDVGVGIIYGPLYCPCGWSESPYYDSTKGESEFSKDHPDHVCLCSGEAVPKEKVEKAAARFGFKVPENL